MLFKGLTKQLKVSDLLRTKVEEIFGADLRSLALLRIGTALIIIYDLINRSLYLSAHYTDAGILPRKAIMKDGTNFFYASFHLMSGDGFVQATLFFIAGLFAIALLLGYRTKLMTIVSWLMLLSLYNRCSIIVYGGDTLLLLILFWGMFLPLGARWSLDSVLAKNLAKQSAASNKNVATLGTFAFLVQIIIVYWFAAMLKSEPEWTKDFTAIYYVLSNIEFGSSLGDFLLKYSSLLKLLTFTVLFYEFVGPLLLLIPSGLIRTIAVLGFVMLQAGIGIFMTLGFVFPLVCCVAVLGLLPSWFWDKVLPKICCYRFLIKLKKYIRMLFSFLPKYSYNVKTNFKLSFYSNYAIIFCLIFIIWVNLWTVSDTFAIPQKVFSMGQLLRISQGWDLFAPSPTVDNYWCVAVGRLKSGKTVDVLNNQENINWARPKHQTSVFPHMRWVRYISFLSYKPDYAQYFARYLCEKWNTEHKGADQLKELEVFFMYERTLPDYQYSPTEKLYFGKYDCVNQVFHANEAILESLQLLE